MIEKYSPKLLALATVVIFEQVSRNLNSLAQTAHDKNDLETL